MAVASDKAGDPAGETRAGVAVALPVGETKAVEVKADASSHGRSPRR